MIILITISVILLIISTILFFRGFNLIERIEELEDLINVYELRDDETKEALNSMLEQMREIDLKGSFESDDEVGSVFTQLKTIIEIYNNIEQDA
jgi:predicted PurR-regulated permease PerM